MGLSGTPRGQYNDWSDAYLLEQFALGPNAYAAPGVFDAIRAEIVRRQLPEPTFAPAARGSAQRPYLARLWRGELPLPVTYWGWFVVGGLGYALADAGLWALAHSSRYLPNVIGTAAFALRLGSYLYWIATLVAVWRSAGRYSGRRLWATLAKIVVAGGAVGVAAIVVHALVRAA